MVESWQETRRCRIPRKRYRETALPHQSINSRPLPRAEATPNGNRGTHQASRAGHGKERFRLLHPEGYSSCLLMRLLMMERKLATVSSLLMKQSASPITSGTIPE